MPIAENRLYADVNAHIVAPATATVQETLLKWRDGNDRFGPGREWWWLVIQYDDNHFTAIPMEQLRDLLMSDQFDVDFDTPLSALPAAKDNPQDWANPLPGVIVARTVDKNSIHTSAALHMAENSPGNVLVVTDGGRVAGIINKRMRNFAMANLSLLALLEEMETAETTQADNQSDAANFPTSPPPPQG